MYDHRLCFPFMLAISFGTRTIHNHFVVPHPDSSIENKMLRKVAWTIPKPTVMTPKANLVGSPRIDFQSSATTVNLRSV